MKEKNMEPFGTERLYQILFKMKPFDKIELIINLMGKIFKKDNISMDLEINFAIFHNNDSKY